MERVRKQQQPMDKLRFVCGEHRCLPAAVGMAAKKNPSSGSPPNRRDRGAQAELVAFRAAARRWPLRPLLTKDKVAAQHSQSCRIKRTGERDQQRSVTVRTRAV